jgi:hypothetical protein
MQDARYAALGGVRIRLNIQAADSCRRRGAVIVSPHIRRGVSAAPF